MILKSKSAKRIRGLPQRAITLQSQPKTIDGRAHRSVIDYTTILGSRQSPIC
jgi:hypothetical protein